MIPPHDSIVEIIPRSNTKLRLTVTCPVQCSKLVLSAAPGAHDNNSEEKSILQLFRVRHISNQQSNNNIVSLTPVAAPRLAVDIFGPGHQAHLWPSEDTNFNQLFAVEPVGNEAAAPAAASSATNSPLSFFQLRLPHVPNQHPQQPLVLHTSSDCTMVHTVAKKNPNDNRVVAQHFSLRVISAEAAASSVIATPTRGLPSTSYQMFELAPRSHPLMRVSLQTFPARNGTHLNFLPRCDANSSDAQKASQRFTMRHLASGAVLLVSAACPGFAIDTTGRGGEPCHMWPLGDNNLNQHFFPVISTVKSASIDYYSFLSPVPSTQPQHSSPHNNTMALDLYNGKIATEAHAENRFSQQFRIIPVKAASAPEAAAASSGGAAPVLIEIIPQHQPGLRVSVGTTSPLSAGTALHLAQAPDQRNRKTSAGEPLVDTSQVFVLDQRSANTVNYITLRPYNDSSLSVSCTSAKMTLQPTATAADSVETAAAQMFQLAVHIHPQQYQNTPNVVTLHTPLANGFVWDINGGGGVGAHVIQWAVHHGPNQAFQLAEVTQQRVTESQDIIRELREEAQRAMERAPMVVREAAEAAIYALAAAISENAATTHSSMTHAAPLPSAKYPEFDEATKLTALHPAWISQSRLQLISQAFSDVQLHPAARVGSGDSNFDWAHCVTRLVMRAYHCNTEAEAKAIVDPVMGRPVFTDLQALAAFSANTNKFPQAYSVSVVVLAELASDDEARAIISQIVDRAFRCESAKQHAIFSMILTAGQLIQRKIREQQQKKQDKGNNNNNNNNNSVRNNDDDDDTAAAATSAPTELGDAIALFFDIVSDYIEDHKLRAFSASFIEPLRFMYMCMNDTCGVDHVVVHGINWLLPIVEHGLGFALPITTATDTCQMALADAWGSWAGVSQTKVWNEFKSQLNFGSAAEAIVKKLGGPSALASLNTRPPRWQVTHHTDFWIQQLTMQHDPRERARVANMAERFAYFFSHEFLPVKMLNSLNSEIKPEHAGFRRAASVLFEEFKRRGLPEKLAPLRVDGDGDDGSGDTNNRSSYDDFDDWCFDDEYYCQPNADRVAMFFCWMGVMRPKEPTSVGNNNSSSNSSNSSKSNIRWPEDPTKFPLFSSAGAKPRSGAAANQHDDDHNSDNAPVDFDQEMPFCGMLKYRSFTSEDAAAEFVQSRARAASAANDDDYGDGSRTASPLLTECAICLERTADVAVLHHPSSLSASVSGDISSHRTCAACREKLGVTCPFCRQVTIGDEFAAVAAQLVAAVSDVGSKASNSSNDNSSAAVNSKGDDGVIQAAAALFESFQIIELEHPNQRILERVAVILLRDPRSGGMIARAIADKKPFVRDAAAVVFRLHALVADALPDGPISKELPREVAAMLEAGVEFIVKGFEQGDAAVMCLDAHHFGALYTQALVALLSAQSSGLPTRTLVAVARRVAHALIAAHGFATPDKKADLAKRAKERFVRDYLIATKPILWGVADSQIDPVVAVFGMP